jgi:hypothetical protein
VTAAGAGLVRDALPLTVPVSVDAASIETAPAAVTVTLALRLYAMAYPLQDTIGSAGCRWIVQINPAAHVWGTSQAAL